MFALKILLFYVSILCLTVPTFAALFYTCKAKNDQTARFPWELVRRVFVAGVAILTAATVLTILA